MIPVTQVELGKLTTACKVCGARAQLYGVVDFNKNCEELRGVRLPLSGVPVYYHQCEACGLLFTEALDRWNKAEYLKHIYNEHYVDVDPDYVEIRPREYSRTVRDFLKPNPQLRHLDYGGGNGKLSSFLNAEGFDSSTWDPMDLAATAPAGMYGMVTAFEVFEHTPAPRATLQEILSFCDPAAPLILFSTYTVDLLPPRSIDFWYVSPRNGHITVHTESSLKALFKPVELNVHHFGNGWHLAYRNVPQWFDLLLFERMYRRSRVHRFAVRLGLDRQGRARQWVDKLVTQVSGSQR